MPDLSPVTATAPHPPRRAPLLRAFEELHAGRTRAVIEEVSDELLEVFAPEGRADLLSQYALPLPLLVTARLLGVTERHSTALMESGGELLIEGRHTDRNLARLSECMNKLTALKRARPEPDLISWMLYYGQGVPEEEIASQARLTLLTGAANGMAWIGSTVHSLTDEDKVDAVVDKALRKPPTPDVVGQLASLGLILPDLTLPGLTRDCGDGHQAALDLVRTIVVTGVARLLYRLPDVEVRGVPEREFGRVSFPEETSPDKLPVAFTPVNDPFTASPLGRWLPPERLFASPPPKTSVGLRRSHPGHNTV